MNNCREAPAPASLFHFLYAPGSGSQMCLLPVIAFTIKEFVGPFDGPTEEDFKMRRQGKGSLYFKMALRASFALPEEFGPETDLRG